MPAPHETLLSESLIDLIGVPASVTTALAVMPTGENSAFVIPGSSRRQFSTACSRSFIWSFIRPFV